MKFCSKEGKGVAGGACKRASEILIRSFDPHCSFFRKNDGGPHGLCFLQDPRGSSLMGGEAQGAVWGLTGRRVGTAQGAALVTPPAPAAASPHASSGSWNLPHTARRRFQHLRRGAEPLLHSRKIFVQGLGTAGEETNATLEPSGRCSVCACERPVCGPPGVPPTPRLRAASSSVL